MHKRMLDVLRETDLPIEPLCCTESEFQKMIENKNQLIRGAGKRVLARGLNKLG